MASEVKNVTVSVGADLGEGRGHVLAYAGYRAVNPITQGDRDFSTCGLSGALGDVGVLVLVEENEAEA